MSEYPKIQSLFKRDMSNHGKLMIGEWSLPEFDYLQNNQWIWTEKIDGTNIRINWDGKVSFAGRTDRAVIPEHLLDYLNHTFSAQKFIECMNGEEVMDITLYGEGYGKKIQHGHNYISDGVGFILFDVRIGKWWLLRDDVNNIAKAMGIKSVPIVGEGSLHDAIDFVSDGFVSIVSENREYQAEGVVAVPSVCFLSRNGGRVITKIKTCDFG